MSSSENPPELVREQTPDLSHSNKNAVKLESSSERNAHQDSVLRSIVSSSTQQLKDDSGREMFLPQSSQYSDRRHVKQSNDRLSDGSRKIHRRSSSAFASDQVAHIDFEDYNGAHFVDNDAEYDQMEEEEDDGGSHDPFANQFLHIGIPATGLKDVSRVKKDLYHDKVYTKKSIISGLHRAVSSVKVSDTRTRTMKGAISASVSSSELTQSIPDTSGMSSFRQLTRMLSLKNTKSSALISCEAKTGQSNLFSPCNKGMQGVSSRTLIGGERSTYPDSEDNTTTPLAKQRKQIVEHEPRNQSMLSTSRLALDRHVIQRHRESTAQKPNVKRQSIRSMEHNLSASQNEQTTSRRPSVEDISSDICTGIVAIADRPRTSLILSQESLRAGGKASLGQVGRMLSLSRQKPSGNTMNDARKNEPGTVKSPSKNASFSNRTKRSSIARIGRAISLSKGRLTSKKSDSNLSKRTQSMSAPKTPRGDADMPRAVHPNNRESQNSEESQKEPSFTTADISSVSHNSQATIVSVLNVYGERKKGENCASAITNMNEMSKPKLRTIGRMFSFTRHSTHATARLSGVQETKGEDKQLQLQSMPSRRPKFERGPTTRPVCATTGRKFYAIEVKSEQLKCNALTRDLTYIRVPIVSMGEYAGPGSRSLWHTDVFTLPHNAVRRECTDLYDILVSIAQSRKDINISTNDIDDLEQWWKVARELFTFYFEVERRILFPWVDSAASHNVDVRVALKKMRAMKDKLQDHLAGVDRVWNEKTFKSQAEMFVLIYKAVDNFVPRLLNYFEDQEVLLPAIARNYYKIEERARIDKEITTLLMGDEVRRNREAPNHRLVLLIRWMNNPKMVRAWTGRYLNSWARNMYPKWYHMLEKQHLRIVKTFQNR